MDRHFCERCRDFVNIAVHIRDRHVNIHCESIEYSERVATCVCCMSEVFVTRLRDRNLEELEKEYNRIIGMEDYDEI